MWTRGCPCGGHGRRTDPVAQPGGLALVEDCTPSLPSSLARMSAMPCTVAAISPGVDLALGHVDHQLLARAHGVGAGAGEGL